MRAVPLVLLLLSSAACGQMSGSRTQHVSRATACTYSEWSAPREVPGLPPGSMVRYPSLAAQGNRAFVVGNDLDVYDEQPMADRPLIALSLRGEDIGKPEGDFWFVYPKAVVDRRGNLHVVWAEPKDSTGAMLRRDFLPAHLRSLWHAIYRPEGGWTTPREVFRASAHAFWAPDSPNLVLGPEDRVHLVTADVPRDPSTLVHLALTRRDVATHKLPVWGGIYAEMALGKRGEVYAAYVGKEQLTETITFSNEILFVRSLDGGRTWSAPAVVRRPAEGAATSVRLLTAPDGTLHLLWGQSVSGGDWPQVVQHMYSRDGGRSWSTPDPLDARAHPQDTFTDLRAVVDRCGAVHVTLEKFSGENEEGGIWYARWNDRWTAMEYPFPTLNSVASTMVSTPDGNVRLFWSSQPLARADPRAPFTPMISEMTVRPRGSAKP